MVGLDRMQRLRTGNPRLPIPFSPLQVLPMRTFLLSMAVVLSLPAWLQAADRSRPGAPHLFPHDVLVYGRVDDATELKRVAAESSMGKLLNDPKLKPLASDLYGAGAELFAQISERVGVSLDELLSIPEGEVAFALLPFSNQPESDENDSPETRGDSPEAIRARIEQRRRRNAMVGAIAIMETGDRSHLLKNMLDRLADTLINQGYASNDQEVFDTQITGFRAPRVSQPGIEYCQRDGVTIFGVGEGVVSEAVTRWQGKEASKSLAQNEDFAAVMGPCVGAEETQPQVTFFVNPYGFAERFIKSGGGGAALVWPIIEDLGFNKLKGIGGSFFSGGEVFDGIMHVHVLVQTPRDGFFSVLRPATGDINPPKWVPNDISSYTTLYWDVPNTYDGLGRILDRFQGEDALERRVEKPLQDAAEVDMRSDIIEQLTGRVTLCRWFEPPARLNSQSQLVGFEVKDAAKAAEVIEKLAKTNDRVIREDEGNVVVYSFGRVGNADSFPANLRRPQPRVALLGNQILYCDSVQLLQRAIRANGGAVPRLTGVVEYDLIASEVGGKLDGQPPFLFSFTRNQEMLRQFYEMAASPGTKEALRRGADSNPAAAKLAEIMDRHELPPFDSLSKYFAPTGSFAYDSPTGIHYTSFTLKSGE